MRRNSSEAYRDSLKAIYAYVSEKEFLLAEDVLLEKIDQIISSGSIQDPDVMQFIHLIYLDFNSFYYEWLSKSGARRIRIRLSDLYTKEHNNYFIGHCSDPAGMDDLLYELLHCKNDGNISEVRLHYAYYIARFKKQRKENKSNS